MKSNNGRMQLNAQLLNRKNFYVPSSGDCSSINYGKISIHKTLFFSGALYQIRQTTDDPSKSATTLYLPGNFLYTLNEFLWQNNRLGNIHSGLLTIFLPALIEL